MINTTILITGKNGQLGQHLVKYFQENYPEFTLVATVRHKSYDKQPVIFDESRVITELLDLTDSVSIDECIKKWKPGYIFNTSANAFVGESWKVPHQHFQVNTIGVLNLLEAVRKFSPDSRFVNLGTSEEFACVLEGEQKPQDENTKISPRSPYGCSKAAARYLVDVYRESYDLYAVQPWTFNFESSLRGEKYFPRKCSLGVARIKRELEQGKIPEPIKFGNLNSYRSWQHAYDVADALWRIANQARPAKDWIPYVISENQTHSLKEFAEKAFLNLGIKGVWNGEGLHEKFLLSREDGLATKRAVPLIEVSKEFFRPMDVTYLRGDSTKLRQELNWQPKYTLDDIINEMVQHDYKNSN